MNGYILLADGMRLDGTLVGGRKTAMGFLVANTAVVGFQEMITDPAYKDAILAFTYPEIGNVGVTQAFSESSRVQAGGLAVKVLSACRSHYLSEDDLVNMLSQAGVPCLTGVDTRGLAVRLRERGEMAAAIAPADRPVEEVGKALAGMSRPKYKPGENSRPAGGGEGPLVAVIDLGIRNSHLRQLSVCCKPLVFPYDASAKSILAAKPAGVFISDGPGGVLPPPESVETIAALAGPTPLLGCGLGHVALGVALGCKATFLKRGHHGANYPVRNTVDGSVAVTEQRHSVVLDRQSVLTNARVTLLYENINDQSVEGIRAQDGSGIGLQATLAAPYPGAVSPHLKRFVDGIAGH